MKGIWNKKYIWKYKVAPAVESNSSYFWEKENVWAKLLLMKLILKCVMMEKIILIFWHIQNTKFQNTYNKIIFAYKINFAIVVVVNLFRSLLFFEKKYV